MRWILLVLLAALASESRAALFIIVNDALADTPPTILVGSPSEVQLGVMNNGASPVVLLNAQASLTITPQSNATGEVVAAVGSASSPLFGPPPSELFSANGVITASAGVAPLAAGEMLSMGQAAGLFSLLLTPSAGASGTFELTASGVAANPLLSTNFVSPPNFLDRLPFDNAASASNGQVLLATIVVSSVPEPSTLSLFCGISCGLFMRRRSLSVR